MRSVEMRRHGHKTGPGNADLSEKGIAHATQMGWEELHGRGFTHFFISTLDRTRQTMQAFATGAGDFLNVEFEVFPLHTAISEMPEAMALWEGPCHDAEKRGEDMLACALDKATEEAEAIAKQSAVAFKEWITSLPEGANALVVHHSPFLELIAYGLFGERLKQLQPLEGFRIIERSGELKLEK